MLALRDYRGPDVAPTEAHAQPKPDPADWLSLQQAACELNLSTSTVRRMIRKGRLRSRIVPRPGGFSYLVFLPGSRHAHSAHTDAPAEVRPRPRLTLVEPASADEESPRSGADAGDVQRYATPHDQIRALERMVDHLSGALSRALRIKQRALPSGMGDPAENPIDPYARYRWLVRRHRWWPF